MRLYISPLFSYLYVVNLFLRVRTSGISRSRGYNPVAREYGTTDWLLNCCWPSPAQSFLVVQSPRDSWPNFTAWRLLQLKCRVLVALQCCNIHPAFCVCVLYYQYLGYPLWLHHPGKATAHDIQRYYGSSYIYYEHFIFLTLPFVYEKTRVYFSTLGILERTCVGVDEDVSNASPRAVKICRTMWTAINTLNRNRDWTNWNLLGNAMYCAFCLVTPEQSLFAVIMNKMEIM
jgi:hypothetical protein